MITTWVNARWSDFCEWLHPTPKQCEHFWRPAIASVPSIESEFAGRVSRPAKVCDDCGEHRILSVAEFYAQNKMEFPK